MFGVLQLRQGRKSAALPAEGQAVLPGGGDEQGIPFIKAYIEDLHVASPPVTGSFVVGEVPQRAPVLAAYLSAHRTMINGSALCAALAVTERD